MCARMTQYEGEIKKQGNIRESNDTSHNDDAHLMTQTILFVKIFDRTKIHITVRSLNSLI